MNTTAPRTSRRRHWAPLLAGAIVIVCAACGLIDDGSSTSPSTPATTDTFTAQLARSGAVVFTFTVAQTGTVAVTLTTVTPTSTTTGLGLGIGTPAADTCAVTRSTSSAQPASTPQLTMSADPGTYCVKVSDAGNLTATVTVTVTVAHS